MSDQSDVPVSQAIEQFVAALPPLPRDQGGIAPEGLSTSPQAAAAAPGKAPAESEKAAKEPEKAPEKKPEQEERFARGFARLAQKEAALEAREKALEAKGAEAEKTAQAAMVQRFRANPIKALRELGLDNDQISTLGRAALGATLENAPPQYKDLAEKLKLDEQQEDVRSELQKLRQEIAREKEESAKARQAEAYRAEYQADLQKHVTDQGLSEHAPNVARLYAADPEGTMRRIYGLVAQDAQQKIRAGRGELMTPAQALKALDEDLAVYAKTFGTSGSGTQETGRDKDAPARKTLSNSTVNPAPTSRTMPDPEKDWGAWKKAQEEAWLAEQIRKGQ